MGAIATPEVAWDVALGGALAEPQLLLADVTGDADPEVLRISAGRVLAAVPGGAPVWRSPQLAAVALYEAVDLDGDGVREVVVQADLPTGVVVLSGADGSVRWTLPTDSEVVDVLAITPAPGELPVLVVNHRFQPIEGHRFTAGFAGGPGASRLWTSATSASWQVSLDAGDTNGDGVLDLVKTFDRTVAVLDVRTGVERARSADLFPENVYFYQSLVADVDGDGRAEILAVDSSYFYSEGSSLVMLGESGASLAERWGVRFVDDVTTGPGNDVFRHQVLVQATSLADLDGAGGLELVFSVWDDAAGAWETRVVSAATGAALATRAGEILEAVVSLDADAPAEIVTRDVDGMDFAGRPTPFFSMLRAFDLTGGALVDRGFRRGPARAALTGSRRRVRSTNGGSISTASDADADGSPDLYIYANYEDEFLNENRAESIEAMRGDTGVSAAGWMFPTYSEGTLLGSALGVLGGPGLDAAVMTTDGDLHLLDVGFADRDAQLAGNHALAPLVASLGEFRDPHVLAVDSRGVLRALASLVLTPDEPLLAWSVRGVDQGDSRGYVQTPGVVLGDDETASIIVRGRAVEDFQRPALLGLGADGTELWRTPLPERTGFSGFSDWVEGDWTGDGVADLFVTLNEPDGAQRLTVRSTMDGTEIASVLLTTLIADADHFQGGVPVDVDGDGRSEIVGTVHPGYVAALALGPAPSLEWSIYPMGGDRMVNGQLVAGELDGDAAVDLLRVNSQNALGPVARLSLGGAIEARFDSGTGGTANRDENNVALVARAGAPGSFDVAVAGMADDRVGRLVLLAGDTLAPRWTTFLGGGAATPATRADVAVLFDPASADIDGDGTADVVVGAADGYLYAIGGADGALLWALELGAPPVHVVIADLDRDPALEILASATDGHLYAIDGPGAYDAERREPPDAGVVVDAGPPATDAGPGALDAGRGPPAAASSCGCRVGSRGTSPIALTLVALALVALVDRRRRA